MLVDHVLCQSFGPNYISIKTEVFFFILEKFENNTTLFPIIEEVLDFFSLFLSTIGRTSAVLFFFLLANGFVYTKNVKKYILRLLGFGVLAQIPYTLFDEGHLVPITEMRFNIMFTLAAALFALWCFEKLKTKPIAAILVVLFLSYLTKVLDFEYSYQAIAYVFFFYYSRNLSRTKRGILGILLVLILYVYRFYPLAAELGLYAFFRMKYYFIGHSLAVLIGLTYNGEKGKSSKGFQYFFYVFYPAHLLILGIIQAVLYR